MKYYGNFSTNNGTRMPENMKSSDRHALNKYVRESAMGQRFSTNTASWWVKDLAGHTVFEGSYYPNVGIRYTVFNYQSRV